MSEDNLFQAIQLVNQSIFAFCHYITPNDVGETGSHQYGFLIAKSCFQMFFDKPGEKGSNMECYVNVVWQKSITLRNRAVYYGRGSRNEYRLTQYGRGFEFLDEKYIGSLLILCKNEGGEINAYVLYDQTDIENFMATFNLDVTIGNQIIGKQQVVEPNSLIAADFAHFVCQHNTFPDTKEMAKFARDSVSKANNYTLDIIANSADNIILQWIDAEYKLFSALEDKIYKPIYSQPFANCHQLIEFSNSILNRRKSRAGKSLEHHLSTIFDAAQLKFEEQGVTENNIMPDFLFPDSQCYHNMMFPADRLTMLGAKTTCKDRWRQVLNEANRIEEKHLFTLQRGVSKNQLKEMKDARLTLVVPRENKSLFLPEFHDNIMCLSDFIAMVKERQS